MTAPASVPELEAVLRVRGVVAPDRAVPGPTPGRPWFVSVLLGVSGWLAGVFCLVFLALLFRPDSPAGLFPFGIVLLAGALALYRGTAGAFTEQLALAFSMAGHLALAIAIGDTTDSATATAALVAVLQGGWLLVVRDRFARLLAALFAAIAFAMAVRFALWGADPSSSRRAGVALGPALAGWAVVWVPLALAAGALVRTELRWVARGLQGLLRPALTGLLLALAFGTLASQPLDALAFWEPDAPRTDWLVLWPLLSIAAAVLALACAHRLRSRALVGASIAGALLHVVHFYMLLGTTLLTKAAIMGVLGAILVAGAVALDRREGAA
jgi:hypothetical protein